MRSTRRSTLLLLLAPYASLEAGQVIPNPNQNRLGFPPNQNQNAPSRDANQPDGRSRRSHAEALACAEELVTRAQQLRDDLKKAGDYVVPISSITETEKIEKLARKIRAQLKT